MIFPSGHTANAVAVWGTLAYLATRHRRAAGAAAGVMALAIGLATVYLGTHWVSDVLGGWAAGAWCCWPCRCSSRTSPRRSGGSDGANGSADSAGSGRARPRPTALARVRTRPVSR
jgi:PAP2 superfamily